MVRFLMKQTLVGSSWYQKNIVTELINWYMPSLCQKIIINLHDHVHPTGYRGKVIKSRTFLSFETTVAVLGTVAYLFHPHHVWVS